MISGAEKIRAWRDDPVRFVRDVFGAEPDAWQIDTLNHLATNQRVAMCASKGVGKSCLEAWALWWFMTTRKKCLCPVTSVTGDNLRDGLWTELARWQSKSPLLMDQFEWQKTSIFHKKHYKDWFISARTWPKNGNPSEQANSLAGLHSEYMMFVVDEVGDVPDAVIATIEAGLSTGKDLKLLVGGNPTQRSGALWRAETIEKDIWKTVHISGDPDDPKRSPRVSEKWAREQILKYGKDNPWVQVNVMGKFPPSSLNALIGEDVVREAMRRRIEPESYEFSQKRLGVDVARFGDDRTVLFPRQGLRAFKPVEMRNARTDMIAARTLVAHSRWMTDGVFVDGTGGYGAGVCDALRQSGLPSHEVNFAAKPQDPRYANCRAEMWFRMKEWLERGGVLPDIPELVPELTSPTYTVVNGKLKLEPKQQIKDRTGSSPDCFIAGTQVLCPGGYRPIESIRVGDDVITPFGSSAVLGTISMVADDVVRHIFSDGRALVGRGSHRVFTWDAGFVPLDLISSVNTIESDSADRRMLWQISSLFGTRERSIGFKHLVDTIKAGTGVRRSDFYTGTFGQDSMETFQRAMSYITSTGTGETTRLQILRSCRDQIINQCTCVRGFGITSTQSGFVSSLTALGVSHPCGTQARTDWSGTASMGWHLGGTERRLSACALCAAKNMVRSSLLGQGSALGLVCREILTRYTKHPLDNARNAALSLDAINTEKIDIAPGPVAQRLDGERVVHSLILSRDNVYYANGILVENCADALALTFYVPDMPRGDSAIAGVTGQARAATSWDPYSELEDD